MDLAKLNLLELTDALQVSLATIAFLSSALMVHVLVIHLFAKCFLLALLTLLGDALTEAVQVIITPVKLSLFARSPLLSSAKLVAVSLV